MRIMARTGRSNETLGTSGRTISLRKSDSRAMGMAVPDVNTLLAPVAILTDDGPRVEGQPFTMYVNDNDDRTIAFWVQWEDTRTAGDEDGNA